MKASNIAGAAISVVPLVVLLFLGVGRGSPAPRGRFSIDVPKVGIVTDNVTKLQWQRAISVQQYSWSGATLCTDATKTLGGAWRLPTVNELATLLSDSQESPARPYIDEVAFPSGGGAFWTRERDSLRQRYYWYVDFTSNSNGLSHSGDIEEAPEIAHLVRCVR
jgi:hypothetical protein